MKFKRKKETSGTVKVRPSLEKNSKSIGINQLTFRLGEQKQKDQDCSSRAQLTRVRFGKSELTELCLESQPEWKRPVESFHSRAEIK